MSISRAAKRDRINVQHTIINDTMRRAEQWLESDKGQAVLIGGVTVLAIFAGFLPQ